MFDGFSPVEATDNLSPNQRCLALIAYAEASSEGKDGMAAVIRVIRNRIDDPRFPDDACAVVRQSGQFQPIEQSKRLRLALANPKRMNLDWVLRANDYYGKLMLGYARQLVVDPGLKKRTDQTKGALYFVNPGLMDRSRCPWFAALKRTTKIGSHVFMRHYAKNERKGPPALDCRKAGNMRYAMK